MVVVQVFQWIARITGVLALLLGLSDWIFSFDAVIGVHIFLGISVAVSLLVMGIMLAATNGLRGLGVAGIIYAAILPLFGLNQTRLLDTNLHWIIQLAHLIVGIGALALVQVMGTRYEQSQTPSSLSPRAG
ncbi:MAG TPA: hypothetical protein VKB76_14820 [Ktedonobacterales bacterium]|nr:hypothetical protein [Ktedonobacterales bacterium]